MSSTSSAHALDRRAPTRRASVVLLAVVGLAATSFAPAPSLLRTEVDPHQPAVEPGVDAPAGAPLATANATARVDAPTVSRQGRPGVHVVEPGDTVSEVAEAYGVSARELARANAVANPRALQPGRVLVVPDPLGPRALTPEQALAADLAVEAALDRAAREHGWRPETVKAVAWAESRWRQQLVSSAGAIGLMQVRPVTADYLADRLGREFDLYDVEDNAAAGVAFLDDLYGRYNGDLRRVLAAYHQGPDSLARDGVLPVTERYIAEVLALRARFTR